MKNNSQPLVSIIILNYNAGNLLLDCVESVLQTNYENYEIIVVDDASEDSSRQVLESLLKVCDVLKVIYHEKNKGYGGTLKTGFNNCTKELFFYTDGDGQYDVYELKRLYRCLNKDVDVVNGYKILRNDPLHRILIGKTYLFLTRLIFNYKSKDVDCDFRLIKRSTIKKIIAFSITQS